MVPRHDKTVIGKLREAPERLAPGHACKPMVSVNGLTKAGASTKINPSVPEGQAS